MKKEKQSRRDFLKTGAAGLAALALAKNVPAAPSDAAAAIEEATVAELQSKMKTGEQVSVSDRCGHFLLPRR